MKQFLVRRWFLVALGLVLLIGFTQAELFRPLADIKVLRQAIVATVLFLMSFPLSFGAMRRALLNPVPALLASVLNYGVLPLIAWGIYLSPIMQGNRDLAVGLLIAATTPSTLASGAVWTRRAGGNDATALLVTIITNLSCFVITPLWLVNMTGQSVESVQFAPMVRRLAMLVVLPMTLAQLLRMYRPLGKWATRQKTPMGVAAQCGVLSMILLGTINAGLKLDSTTNGQHVLMQDFLIMVAVVMGIHLLVLWMGHTSGRLLGLARPERIAVGFSGSQKTLMVGLTVALEDYKMLALAVLPMVTYHVGQLLVDTVIADRLKARENGEMDTGI